ILLILCFSRIMWILVKGLLLKAQVLFRDSSLQLSFNYVETEIQKMQPDAEAKYLYTSSFDCAMETLKARGPFKFCTGFPICVRIALHVM
ncbi:hypothetical protein UlMin_031582, partial [Ulmus minor]